MEKGFDFNKELMEIYPRLDKLSFRYGLPEFDRQDLVSETILKIIEKKHMFRIQGCEYKVYKFLGWCTRIMHNNFINNYRKSVRYGDVIDNTIPLLMISAPSVTFADENIQEEQLVNIIRETESNEENVRIFFDYFNGYKYKEISDKFNLPLGTVKSRLFSTKQKVKQALQKQEYI